VGKRMRPACSRHDRELSGSRSGRRDPEGVPDPLAKEGLSGAELPRERDHVPGRSASPSAAGDRQGLSAGEFDMNRRLHLSHIRICPPCSGSRGGFHSATFATCVRSLRISARRNLRLAPYAASWNPRCALRMSSFFRRGFAERVVQRAPDVADHRRSRHRKSSGGRAAAGRPTSRAGIRPPQRRRSAKAPGGERRDHPGQGVPHPARRAMYGFPSCD